MFLDTSGGSFSVCLCVSDCASACLCTWSMREPTPYALQMSSCLIINPTFHAFVNFIIKLRTLWGLHASTHTHTHGATRARLPPPKTATVEERLHQTQLSLISLYLRHLFPLPLFIASVTSHICCLLLIPLCSSLFVSYPVYVLTFASLCSVYLPGRFSSKRKEKCSFFFYILFFLYIFIFHFWRVHFFFKCHLEGSISQVLLCPPTCKAQSHPRLHPHPIHQDMQQPASPTPASFLIN